MATTERPVTFTVEPGHPLATEHRLIEAFLDECDRRRAYHSNVSELDTVQALARAEGAAQVRVVRAAVERRAQVQRALHAIFRTDPSPTAAADQGRWETVESLQHQLAALNCLLESCFRRRLPYAAGDIKGVLSHIVEDEGAGLWRPFSQSLKDVEAFAARGLSPELRLLVDQIARQVNRIAQSQMSRELLKLSEAVSRIEGVRPPVLDEGESWAAALLERLAELPAEQAEAWCRLLAHCRTATATSPSQKWLKQAQALVDAVGCDTFAGSLQGWLALFGAHVQAISERNIDVLRGLVWCASLAPSEDLARAVTGIVPSCFRTVEHPHEYDAGIETYHFVSTGPRAVRVASAAFWTLSHWEGLQGVAHLARLRLRVKHGAAQRTVERALAEAAKRLNMLPDEVEELAVPDFGLGPGGVLEQTLGDWRVRITFATSKGVWQWLGPDGKSPRSAPAAVKQQYAADLKRLKGTASDIEKMLPAQAERLDEIMRLERTWPLQVWRQRYLDHPLLGLLIQRLIWEFGEPGQPVVALPHQGQLLDATGTVVPWPPDNTSVRLWHPITSPTDAVMAWRRRLEDRGIRQPFKQAHREIYLLTDAERATHTYSNRFAGHVLRQHQFNSLCAARGWKNKLRLMVDDVYPPASKEFADLRAEFWIEGIGDNYGDDTNDSGTYLRVVTDQVRFYRRDAAQNLAHAGGGGYGAGWRDAPAQPLPLDRVPPLLFS